MNKVIIIGCSNVGMSYAQNLVLRDINIDELALIDLEEERIEGEVIDLNHSLAFTNNYIRIKKGNYKDDCKDARLVVICAGRNQKKGETRQQLIDSNIKIIDSILVSCMQNKFKGIYIIVSNPVDILSLYAYKKLGIDKSKVFGSGTSLDTARLQYDIGKKLRINPKYINAYVLGEHGDSEMVAWSSATIANKPISNFLSADDMQRIEQNVRHSAYEIINKKGFTNYGIGSAVFAITYAILSNENYILPVSTYDEKNDIFYSRPASIGKNGIEQVFDLELSKQDKKNLQKSINYLKDTKNKLNI